MTMRSIRITVLAAGAVFLASAVVPAASRSMGFHGVSDMNAGGSSFSHAGAPNAHPVPDPVSRSSSVIKQGPVALAKKKAGKLNGACYRSCVKTSMGDAFRTDQFCAYSCSLD
jgi:hypothetical protein